MQNGWGGPALSCRPHQVRFMAAEKVCRSNIKVRSLVPAIEKGKLIATISYPRSRPPPKTIDEDLEVDREFIGLTPLNTPQEPILAHVVAVTGLAGHAFGSWSSSLHQMW